jgi:hypothetical protein
MTEKKPTVTITVSGPVGCGKTLMCDAIKETLEIRLGCSVVLDPGLLTEQGLRGQFDPADWERDMLSKQVVLLVEAVDHGTKEPISTTEVPEQRNRVIEPY